MKRLKSLAMSNRATTEQDLDFMLECWARWVHQGGVIPAKLGYQAQLDFERVNTGGKGVSHDGTGFDEREIKVERAVGQLHQLDKTAAVVLRVEYNAHPDIWLDARERQSQASIAKKLGISKSQYSKSLNKARLGVMMFLAGFGNGNDDNEGLKHGTH